MNLPPGEYVVVGDHHANMKPNDLLIKVVEGEHAGKGFRMNFPEPFQVKGMRIIGGDIIDES
jgi:hypothetical protein